MSTFKSEKPAMEAMYDKYADLLYRLALMNLGSEDDAQDAVHDCFMKYLEKSPRFDSESHQEGWFVKVTVNICRDILRKKKYRSYVPLEDAHNIGAESREPSEVFTYLQALSPRYKTVIILHYLEGYSVKEVAEMLSISQSAVKMRLSRGRELLKEKIEKED